MSTPDAVPLTADDRMWLARCTVGHQPFMDWLGSDPPVDKACAMLVKFLDRGGPCSVFARVLGAHLGVDPVQVYAKNYPRKAARLAADARAHGDQPHADSLHAALVALMFCANCGRPLNDPVSIERGIGPDCWERIDPRWRQAIAGRIAPRRVGSIDSAENGPVDERLFGSFRNTGASRGLIPQQFALSLV